MTKLEETKEQSGKEGSELGGVQRYRRYSPAASSRERRQPFLRSRAGEEARQSPRPCLHLQEPVKSLAWGWGGMGVGRPGQGAREEGWLAVSWVWGSGWGLGGRAGKPCNRKLQAPPGAAQIPQALEMRRGTDSFEQKFSGEEQIA